jgi:hypothetical protein
MLYQLERQKNGFFFASQSATTGAVTASNFAQSTPAPFIQDINFL